MNRLILIFSVSFDFCFAIAFRRAPRKFIKISSKKNDIWKQMAEAALCSSRDSDNVMEALTSFDKRSHWFVLVSPADRAGRRRRGRRRQQVKPPLDFRIKTSTRYKHVAVVGEVNIAATF